MARQIQDARILIVDDEAVNVRLLERILQGAGYADARGITDSRQVRGELRESEPDLILLDLHMPHLDGNAVLAQLRADLHPEAFLPVLVLSADNMPDARRSVLASGAHDFVSKPFDREEVLLRVRNLLQTRFLHLSLRRHGERLESEVARRTRELREALHAAEEASRAKSQFLANMSHELRTPLNGLRGPLALVVKRYADALPDPARRMLDVALRSSERLERGVLDLLRLMDLQSGDVVPERGPLELAPMLAALAAEYTEKAAAKGLAFTCPLPPPLPPVLSDEKALREVLGRVLDNAIRFTDSGEVSLTVAAEPAPGTAAAIRVRDTGEGIDPAYHERIFRPFEQGDNSDTRRHQGFGLGLAIARALCDCAGCTVRVESEPGVGSTFIVALRGDAPPDTLASDGPRG